MGKAPAFQFYVRDWLSDPQLQSVSASTRGIWINCLCFMWESPERGKLTGYSEKLSRLLNCSNDEFFRFLNEANETEFASIKIESNVTFPLHVTLGNIFVTVMNRRMARDDKQRKNTRLRVRKFRSKAECNAPVTVPSSSSSSCTKVHRAGKPLSATPPFPEKSRLKNPNSTKEKAYIETAIELLYEQRGFKKVHALCNTMRKEGRNEKTIAHALKRCIESGKTGDLWGYCYAISKVEDGNFNEADFKADQEAKGKDRPESLKEIFKKAQEGTF